MWWESGPGHRHRDREVDGFVSYLESRIKRNQGESDMAPTFKKLTVQQRRNSMDVNSNYNHCFASHRGF